MKERKDKFNDTIHFISNNVDETIVFPCVGTMFSRSNSRF